MQDSLLLRREAIGVGRVDRGKDRVGELVGGAVHRHRAPVKVNGAQQLAVGQPKRGVLVDEPGLRLELDDGHGLLHLDGALQVGGRQVGASLEAKGRTGVVRIGAHRKVEQRREVHAVGVGEHGEVAVTGADAHHVADAAGLPERRAHPHDVVVSPGDARLGEARHLVQNEVGRRSPVKDVAQQVEALHGQQLDGASQGADKIDCLRQLRRLLGRQAPLKQLLYRGGQRARRGGGHLACGPLLRVAAQKRRQLRDEGGQQRRPLLYPHPVQQARCALAGIADKRRQAGAVGLRQVGKRFVDGPSHPAARAAQNVRELLVLAVRVGDEKLDGGKDGRSAWLGVLRVGHESSR